jgi:hypothetical protein
MALQHDVASGALLTNADLEEAFAGLDYLNNLLPPPFGDLVLPDQLQGSGEIGSQARLDHCRRFSLPTKSMWGSFAKCRLKRTGLLLLVHVTFPSS